MKQIIRLNDFLEETGMPRAIMTKIIHSEVGKGCVIKPSKYAWAYIDTQRFFEKYNNGEFDALISAGAGEGQEA